jgi:hypothetical protein
MSTTKPREHRGIPLKASDFCESTGSRRSPHFVCGFTTLIYDEDASSVSVCCRRPDGASLAQKARHGATLSGL